MKKICTIALVVSCLAILSSCEDDNRVTPMPPAPKPKAAILALGDVSMMPVIRDGKMSSQWQDDDILSIHGLGKEMKYPYSITTKYNRNGFAPTSKQDPELERKIEELYFSFIPEGAGELAISNEAKTFSPTLKKEVTVGDYTVTTGFEDVLLGHAQKTDKKKVSAVMRSPYTQVRLIITNSDYEQTTDKVSIMIPEVLTTGASYDLDNATWRGDAGNALITSDKPRVWEGQQADTLFIALPITAGKDLSAEINYVIKGKERTAQRTFRATPGQMTTIAFTIEEEEDDNTTPLAFTPLVDDAYWRQANKEAMDKILPNLVKMEDSPETREFYFNIASPNLYEYSMTRTLYREEANLIVWNTTRWNGGLGEETDPFRALQYAVGLTDMSGNIVEIYPPYYSYRTGTETCLFPYCYVTVPPGKYRTVLFFKDSEMSGDTKWYQLPLMESFTGSEMADYTLPEKDGVVQCFRWRGRTAGDPKTLEECSTRDMDIVEVVDRTERKIVAPLWYDIEINNQRLKHDEITFSDGETISVKLLNRSNHRIKGTIVVRREALSFFSKQPLVQELMKITHKQCSGLFKEWEIMDPMQDYTEVIMEKKIAIDENAEKIFSFTIPQGFQRSRLLGIANVTPDQQVKLYWKDETGKETMINRSFHDMMKGMESVGYGKSGVPFFGINGFMDDAGQDNSMSCFRFTYPLPHADPRNSLDW